MKLLLKISILKRVLFVNAAVLLHLFQSYDALLFMM